MPSLDLGPILDIAAGLVGDALDTMGTVGDITRPGVVQAADPDTAQPVGPAAPVIATQVPAILIAPTPGSQQPSYPGAPTAEEGRWTLQLPAAVTDLRRGDVWTCTASRDPRMPGRAWEITLTEAGSAGVVRTVLARAVTQAGLT